MSGVEEDTETCPNEVELMQINNVSCYIVSPMEHQNRFIYEITLFELLATRRYNPSRTILVYISVATIMGWNTPGCIKKCISFKVIDLATYYNTNELVLDPYHLRI